MQENKLSMEFAEQEFNRFLDTMGISHELKNAEDEEVFNKHKTRIVGALCVGSLVITETGEPCFTPVRSLDKTPITFYEPDGKVLQAMDKRSEGCYISKLYEIIAAMTRTKAEKFQQMKIADFRICEALASLFLAG
jgi:hypothetical protein